MLFWASERAGEGEVVSKEVARRRGARKDERTGREERQL